MTPAPGGRARGAEHGRSRSLPDQGRDTDRVPADVERDRRRGDDRVPRAAPAGRSGARLGPDLERLLGGLEGLGLLDVQ
jgi:hypothetical protein